MSCSNQDTDIEEEYIPVPFSLKVPELFQQKLIDPLIPNNNPLTEEGVALGKKLFLTKNFLETIHKLVQHVISHKIRLQMTPVLAME